MDTAEHSQPALFEILADEAPPKATTTIKPGKTEPNSAWQQHSQENREANPAQEMARCVICQHSGPVRQMATTSYHEANQRFKQEKGDPSASLSLPNTAQTDAAVTTCPEGQHLAFSGNGCPWWSPKNFTGKKEAHPLIRVGRFCSNCSHGIRYQDPIINPGDSHTFCSRGHNNDPLEVKRWHQFERQPYDLLNPPTDLTGKPIAPEQDQPVLIGEHRLYLWQILTVQLVTFKAPDHSPPESWAYSYQTSPHGGGSSFCNEAYAHALMELGIPDDTDLTIHPEPLNTAQFYQIIDPLRRTIGLPRWRNRHGDEPGEE